MGGAGDAFPAGIVKRSTPAAAPAAAPPAFFAAAAMAVNVAANESDGRDTAGVGRTVDATRHVGLRPVACGRWPVPVPVRDTRSYTHLHRSHRSPAEATVARGQQHCKKHQVLADDFA